jgi:hypothetical protein
MPASPDLLAEVKGRESAWRDADLRPLASALCLLLPPSVLCPMSSDWKAPRLVKILPDPNSPSKFGLDFGLTVQAVLLER